MPSKTEDQWKSSPQALLARLRDPAISRDDLLQTVLFAEVARFDPKETAQLLPLLFDFVRENRFSADDDVMTAVGSAIRKFAMNSTPAEFEAYADLLAPSETQTLPCEIELELTKAMLWRLTSDPPADASALPKLTARLTELASDYLSPRLILQKNYATIVLDAVLCVLLLGGEHSARLVDEIRGLGLAWFVDLFERKLSRVQADLLSSGTDAGQQAAGRLAQFAPEYVGTETSQ